MRLRALAKRAIPAPARRRLKSFRAKLLVVRRYRALRKAPLRSLQYLATDRELDNFTYDIANRDELARFLAETLAIDPGEARAYVAELDADTQLRDEITTRLADRRDRNPRMPFGRRLGWYAIVRARRPRLVVETGVHDGLGSTAILRALERNADAGEEGTLVSFDINGRCGWLIPPRLRERHHLVIADAVSSIPRTLGSDAVDLFIHDSDHRYVHEMAELEAIRALATDETIYLSDNAHATSALKDFAQAQDLAFAFWPEKPARHFYPGAGIGIALRRRPGTQ